MFFVFGSVYVVNYIYRLVYVESALHPQDEGFLIMMDKLFDVLFQWLCQIILKIFVSMSIMDIGLSFLFLLGLCWVLVS